MKVAYVKNGKIELGDAPKPSLGDGFGAIIKTSGCGLCGSDIVKLRQKLVPEGTVLGHEVVGEIVEINSKTDFKPGDRIVTAHHIPCFDCIYCNNYNYSMCENFKKTNILPGGFSEYIYLSEEHLQNVAYKIPASLTEPEASFYEPLACCIRAIKRSDKCISKNKKVLVIGQGSIGILMGQALKAYGHDVWGCDILDKRINSASELGIKTFHPDKILGKILSETNNIGADAVFMTSGADAAVELAFKSVRSGGKIIVFASTPKNFGYANNEIYYRELTVMGSYSPSPEDLKESINLLVNKKINVKGIPVVYNLVDIDKAFRDTIDNNILKAYIKM